MKTIRKIAVLALLLCLGGPVMAQATDQDYMLGRRAAEKVAQMNDYISFMANKKKSQDNRMYYRRKALNLFMGKGDSYEENGVTKAGVQMEVTSKYRSSVSHKYMRTYFTNLVNGLTAYDDVQISSTEIANIKVSNLRQVGDNLYVCTCEYSQAFAGYRDGRIIYKDITTKRIKCYVKTEDTEDGVEYIILLGDVYAIDTK
ncbi:MAG: hypothetical protein LUB83_00635 [Prevotellaceae bacterium]|nr:hypothetical protein [Prevotellaceae bacterium]